jgi:hypothetical protein
VLTTGRLRCVDYVQVAVCLLRAGCGVLTTCRLRCVDYVQVAVC